MLAKIAGVLLLICGAFLAVKLIGPVIGGIFSLIGVLLMGVLVLFLIYLGWRWINGEGSVAKVLGAFALVGGILLAVPAALGVVASVFGALVLAFKIVLAVFLLYVGWGWLQSGEFRLGGGRRYA